MEVTAKILKGPLSPLATSVLSAHKPNWKCHGKEKIVGDSVNSILLDASPRVKHNVWMVAAQLQVSEGTGDTLLRLKKYYLKYAYLWQRFHLNMLDTLYFFL